MNAPSLNKHAYFRFFVLASLSILPLSSNATLLGRLNAYYNNNQLPTTDVNSLKLQQTSLDAQIAALDSRGKKEDALSNNDYLLYSKLKNQKVKVDSLLQLYSSQKIKFDAWHQAEADSTKAAMDADAEGADESTKQKAKEAKDAAEIKRAEFDIVQNELFQKKNTVVDETSNGIAEGAASTATLINSNSGGANTSLALRAYQYNLIIWPKKSVSNNLAESRGSANEIDLTKYAYIPMYIFLKKPVDSIVNKVTLYGDLLDNEHGGTLNIKLSRGYKWFQPWFSENEENFKGYGLKFICDSGIKIIEAPALQLAAPNTTNSNWIGAGYIGMGLNLELPITESLQTSKGTPGATPAGGMALGIGIYRNHVNATQFDNTPFPGRVPNYYNTWALMYEMQITELLSIKATRMVPKDKNALGTYSAFQVSYKF